MVWEATVFWLLLLLTVLFVVNSFIGHLTPDISIYLCHTRTFLETLDRFTLLHDSMGIFLIWALVAPVWLLGATVPAAAKAQLIAYGVALFCIYRIMRSFTRRIPALFIGWLCIVTVYSHVIWGGNTRPEDFALA